MPFANWSLHFETDLELAQKELDEGNEITVVYCDGELPTCEPNPKHVSIMCRRCQARRDAGFEWLGKEGVTYLSLSEIGKIDELSISKLMQSCSNVQSIRNCRVEGNDVGMAAISSTVSFYREPKLQEEEHGALLKTNLHTALMIYHRFSSFLQKNLYDKIIVFNGRYSTFRPLVRIAQKYNIELLVHERGYEVNTYNVACNVYPHAIEYIENKIIQYAGDNVSYREKYRLGEEWFKEREKGQGLNWKSFTKEQQKGFLPEELSKKVFNIVMFNSSEDEMVAIEEWKNPYYSDQNEGIQKILESLKIYTDIHLYLRVHPNLKGIENSQIKELKEIDEAYSNLTIILPESPISTYTLIEVSDLIITFGSTVGIEAAFMKKPVIVMGRAPYLVLNSCIMPINHQSMIEIVLNFKNEGEIPFHDVSKAYLYGSYMKLVSQPFTYVEQTGISTALLVKNGKITDLNKNIRVYITWIERGMFKLWKILWRR